MMRLKARGRNTGWLLASGLAAALAVQAAAMAATPEDTAQSGDAEKAGASSPAASVPAEQKSAIEAIVHDYLMANPEVILKSLRDYQAKAQEQEKERAQVALGEARDELVADPQSPVAGNPDGDVTVVEFFDYNCGYCKRVFPSVQEMLKKDDKVRYVFKEYPILAESSMTAARAALAAWNIDPEKYFAFHTALMKSRGALDEDRILDLAEQVGLDRDKVERGMANPEIAAEIRQNLALGQRIGVTGTPAFVIGGEMVPGAVSLETLEEKIGKAREG